MLPPTRPMEREGAQNAAAPAPAWMVTCRQREPPFFAGLRGDDVEEWLEQYNHVSQFNGWNDTFKLQTARFYLTKVAETWYQNNHGGIYDWADFTEKLRRIFGTPSARSDGAKRALEARWQRSDETYVSYIEDVLALCHRVSPDMSEADKVRHILKGITESAFNALALQNPSTVNDIRTTCQRLDELQAMRLQPAHGQARLPAEPDLRVLIRSIIREELQLQASPCAHGDRCSQPATNLREIIKDELASITGNPRHRHPVIFDVPSYAEAASRTPVSSMEISVPPSVLGRVAAVSSPPPAETGYTNWRPRLDLRPNDRPVCFYCGIRGHISRFCRRRQRDEQRGYAPYERDVRYNYGPRGRAYPPRQRSPSPQDSVILPAVTVIRRDAVRLRLRAVLCHLSAPLCVTLAANRKTRCCSLWRANCIGRTTHNSSRAPIKYFASSSGRCVCASFSRHRGQSLCDAFGFVFTFTKSANPIHWPGTIQREWTSYKAYWNLYSTCFHRK